MRCDVLAIGTELLLGQIVDTNSSWIGEQLAAAGIDTCEHRKVGDNLERMVQCLRELLDRADAVIVCGGLGPTPDDVTREAIAEVMGVELERREELIEHIREIFGGRGRPFPENNLRQADVPVGGDVIPNPIGTAPGLQCEVVIDGRTKVVYAVPGVPYEMTRDGQQVRAARPARALRGARGDRVALAEDVGHVGVGARGDDRRARRPADQPHHRVPRPRHRGHLRAHDRQGARPKTRRATLLDAEDVELRKVLGDLVFAVDDDTMESEVLRLCEERGWSLGVAESLTGGFIGARITNVPGASRTFRGSIASYATDVKRSRARRHRRAGRQRGGGQADGGRARSACSAPTSPSRSPASPAPTRRTANRSAPSGTASRSPGHEPEAVTARLPFDRERIRQFSTITLLNTLRMRLLSLP